MTLAQIKHRRETPSDTVRDEEKGVANPRHEFPYRIVPYRGQVLKYQPDLACLGVRPLNSWITQEKHTYCGQVLEYQFVLGVNRMPGKLLSDIRLIVVPSSMYRHDDSNFGVHYPSLNRDVVELWTWRESANDSPLEAKET